MTHRRRLDIAWSELDAPFDFSARPSPRRVLPSCPTFTSSFCAATFLRVMSSTITLCASLCPHLADRKKILTR
jgi:hypothetical protein